MGGAAPLRLLLDTHVWLHSLVDPARLGRRARAALRRAGNELWLSPISVWELLLLARRQIDEARGQVREQPLELRELLGGGERNGGRRRSGQNGYPSGRGEERSYDVRVTRA